MAIWIWLTGFLLALISVEAFVRISRYEVNVQPVTKGRASLRTVSDAVPLMLLSFGAILVAALAVPRNQHLLEVLLPSVALAGWSACWARGLERYIDSCYPDKALSTFSLQLVSLAPIGVALLGIHRVSPIDTPLETILVSASLLPVYLLFSVLLVQRAYPRIVLKREVLHSMAFRFAIGFAIVGVVAGLLWTYVPFLHQSDYTQLFWWFIPYLLGARQEAALARRLARDRQLEEEDLSSPFVTPTVSQAPDNTQTLTLRH